MANRRPSRSTRYLAPLFIAGLLSACDDDFMATPSLDVALPASLSNEPAEPKQTPPPPAPLAREWWKAANDATLNQLMEKIEKQNLSIEQARLRLQAARVQVGGSSFLPMLNLNQATDFEPVSVYQQRTNPSGVPENTHLTSRFGGFHQIGLDAQWEVPLFGSYHAAEEQAKAEVAFADADVEAVRGAIYAEAVTEYIELRRAQNKLAVLKTMEASQAHIVKLIGIRVGAGLSNESERSQNQQMLLAIQSEIASTESNVTDYKQRLAKLEGNATTDAMLDAPGPLVTFPPMQFTDTPADIIRNRPDVRKAEQNVITAGDELKLAKNERYPKLTFEGQLFKFDNLLAHPQPDTSPAGSFAEGITMPLFNWGKLTAIAHAKDAKLAENASIYRETVVGAVTEASTRLAEYRAAGTARNNATQSLTETEIMAQKARTLNSQGLGNQIALENAAIAKQRAAIESASATSNESISLANLTKALGGGLVGKETDSAEKK